MYFKITFQEQNSKLILLSSLTIILNIFISLLPGGPAEKWTLGYPEFSFYQKYGMAIQRVSVKYLLSKLDFCCNIHTFADFPCISMAIPAAGWPKILNSAEQESLERPIYFLRSKPSGPVLQMHGNVMPLSWLLTHTLDSP